MKKMTKIVSLLLAVTTLCTLAACSGTPDYPVDEMLKKGYAMLDPEGKTTKSFTLAITQGENYAYTFNGRIANGSILSSLTVSRNGLKSNYKNLFLINGGKLHINLNGAMSAAESEIGFLWTDTSAMQNRYLTIENGYNLTKDFINSVKSSVFSDWSANRTASENGKGDYDYNLTYNGDTAKNLINALSTKHTENAEKLASVINANIKTLTDKSFSVYETSMHYYQDKIDVETGKTTGKYESSGEHFNKLMTQELNALKNLINRGGSCITENISYIDKEGKREFQHVIAFCDKNGNPFGKISLQVNETGVDKIDPTIYNYIKMEDFVGAMNTNIKNAKGVGYETNDFPYVATYTANELTLTETNDLYKSVHVFTFNQATVTKYTVTFYTYDMYMHNALMNKYNTMNMKLVAANADKLMKGTGSGVLQYSSDSVGSKYNANDPIELLKLLEIIGVPTYGD